MSTALHILIDYLATLSNLAWSLESFFELSRSSTHAGLSCEPNSLYRISSISPAASLMLCQASHVPHCTNTMPLSHAMGFTILVVLPSAGNTPLQLDAQDIWTVCTREVKVLYIKEWTIEMITHRTYCK